ncbi:hypothetical protein TNIN_90501 [Trichonephila inaurata madagascariensis]|uniref:Transmembrane protein n=1 Tax=Trichonephila inaurata madagascariensis TaxID=2747483 RepID=A0A8X6X8N3_9ARAC|nr:hypothetical protein TNIN_90501 [Trichonephila inaurata madagascariensis]
MSLNVPEKENQKTMAKSRRQLHAFAVMPLALLCFHLRIIIVSQISLPFWSLSGTCFDLNSFGRSVTSHPPEGSPSSIFGISVHGNLSKEV